MQCDEVGPLDQLVEVHLAPAACRDLLGGQIGIAGENLHLEGVAELRDDRPDPPNAHDADGLVLNIVALQRRIVGAAAPLDHAVAHRDPLRQREDEAEGVLGHGLGVGARLVAGNDPRLRAGVNLDRIVARPIAQMASRFGQRLKNSRVPNQGLRRSWIEEI